ncbi:MAG: hypothetical protein HYY35_09160 [Deltaproteobacteria bacterium]|nr:hypothetical protein [Deltaproteobacteria bacterium]
MIGPLVVADPKVVRDLEERAQSYLVHFTAVPPEVDAYFQAHLRHGLRP